MFSFISLPVTIALIAIAVVLLIVVITQGVKVNKLKEETEKAISDKSQLELDLSNLEVDNKSLSIDVESKTNEIKALNKKLDQTSLELSTIESRFNSKIIEINDVTPKSLNSKVPDLSEYKDFRACWMKLQNEAFRKGALKLIDGKVTLKFV